MKIIMTIFLTLTISYAGMNIIANQYLIRKSKIAQSAPKNYVMYRGISYKNVESVEVAILHSLYAKVFF